jgi:hypothetical protein
MCSEVKKTQNVSIYIDTRAVCARNKTYNIDTTEGRAYEGDPKVSGLVAWSENCKWYSSLPLGAVVSLFCESV